MYIVFGIVRYIVVDNQRHIVHIYTTGDDVGGYEYIHFAVAEIEHYLVPLFLLEVGEHCPSVDMLCPQRTGQVPHFLFLTYEKDDFLQSTPLEQVLYHSGLLRLVELHRHLMNTLGRA